MSSAPSGSPLNWYEATCSVHFTVPSIRKSTELTVVPLGAAVHLTEPVSAAPSAMLEVTTKDDGGGGAVAPLATVTALVVVAVRPSAAWAWRASVWAPLLSVVVSSLPPSPLNS